MEFLTYDKARKRVWILGKRIHHGAAGFVCAAVGLILMVHDRRDAPWLRDNE